MKKIFLLVAFMTMGWLGAQAQDCGDGPYGVQINGGTVVEAPAFGEADHQGRAQYKASCVELKAGDEVRLINTSCDATWMVDIDPYGSYQNFEGGKTAGKLTCKVEGNYDFYIKLSMDVGDLLYIGPAEGCGGTYDPTGCQDGPYGIKIGSNVVDAPAFGEPDFQGRKQYRAVCVEINAGDEVQLINKSCDATWMVDLDPYGQYENFEGGKATNKLVCKVAGSYDFYIKLSMDEGDLVYVETSQNCGGDIPTPVYSGSVPEKCPDVLLQAFYWDSYQMETEEDSKTKVYGRTKWVDFLKKYVDEAKTVSVAEEMAQWFDMIWLPPMSYGSGGTGYLPIQYSKLDSDWGTQKNLVKMINLFHENGARVIADIVVNHIYPQSGWCSFATQNFGKYGVYKPDASWICSTDEMNWESNQAKAGSCYGKATGNADDGYGTEANYEPARDWDHRNTEVQKMIKAYLNWLRDEVKIDGFRYDYCKGFNNWHIGDYNSAAKAYFSVMEMWDGNVNTLQYHLNEANWNTSTFDFATKYTAFNDGIRYGKYENLKGAGLPGAGKARWAVTFLDSHDSFLRDDNEFFGFGESMKHPNEIKQCYAYLLSMPGVPLVFYPHWVTFKDDIKKMINARYKAGVHSESAVSDEAGNGYYKATITGTNGEIRLLLGPNSGYNSTPSGYQLAVKGTNFGVYYKENTSRGNKNENRQPVIPEGIEDVPSDNVQAVKGEKFIQNGQLFIRLGDKTYDIMGRSIK